MVVQLGKHYTSVDLPQFSAILSQHYVNILELKQLEKIFGLSANIPSATFQQLEQFYSVYSAFKEGRFNCKTSSQSQKKGRATAPELAVKLQRLVERSQAWANTTYNPLFTDIVSRNDKTPSFVLNSVNSHNQHLLFEDFSQIYNNNTYSINGKYIMLRMTVTAHAIVFDIIDIRNDPFFHYHLLNSSSNNGSLNANSISHLQTKLPSLSSSQALNSTFAVTSSSSTSPSNCISSSTALTPTSSLYMTYNELLNQSRTIKTSVDFDYYCLQPFSYHPILPQIPRLPNSPTALYGSLSLKFIIPLGNLIDAPVLDSSNLVASFFEQLFQTNQLDNAERQGSMPSLPSNPPATTPTSSNSLDVRGPTNLSQVANVVSQQHKILNSYYQHLFVGCDPTSDSQSSSSNVSGASSLLRHSQKLIPNGRRQSDIANNNNQLVRFSDVSYATLMFNVPSDYSFIRLLHFHQKDHLDALARRITANSATLNQPLHSNRSSGKLSTASEFSSDAPLVSQVARSLLPHKQPGEINASLISTGQQENASLGMDTQDFVEVMHPPHHLTRSRPYELTEHPYAMHTTAGILSICCLYNNPITALWQRQLDILLSLETIAQTVGSDHNTNNNMPINEIAQRVHSYAPVPLLSSNPSQLTHHLPLSPLVTSSQVVHHALQHQYQNGSGGPSQQRPSSSTQVQMHDESIAIAPYGHYSRQQVHSTLRHIAQATPNWIDSPLPAEALGLTTTRCGFGLSTLFSILQLYSQTLYLPQQSEHSWYAAGLIASGLQLFPDLELPHSSTTSSTLTPAALMSVPSEHQCWAQCQTILAKLYTSWQQALLMNEAPTQTIYSILPLPTPRSLLILANPHGGAGGAIRDLRACFHSYFYSGHQVFIHATQCQGDAIDHSYISECAFGWQGDPHLPIFREEIAACNALFDSALPELVIPPVSSPAQQFDNDEAQNIDNFVSLRSVVVGDNSSSTGVSPIVAEQFSVSHPLSTLDAVRHPAMLGAQHFYDTVLLLSGDGLVNEIINGVMKSSHWTYTMRNCSFCHIPCGSGNGVSASVQSISNTCGDQLSAFFLCLQGSARKLDMFTLSQDAQRPVAAHADYSDLIDQQDDGTHAALHHQQQQQWESRRNALQHHDFYEQFDRDDILRSQPILSQHKEAVHENRVPRCAEMSTPLPRGTYCGVLSLSWALISDLDFESERWRCCGGARFEFAAALRVLLLRKYKARIEVLLDDNAIMAQQNHQQRRSPSTSPRSHDTNAAFFARDPKHDLDTVVEYVKSERERVPVLNQSNNVYTRNFAPSIYKASLSANATTTSATSFANSSADDQLQICGADCVVCHHQAIEQAKLPLDLRDVSKLEHWANGSLRFASEATPLAHTMGCVHGTQSVRDITTTPQAITTGSGQTVNIAKEKWFPLYPAAPGLEGDGNTIGEDFTVVWAFNVTHGAADVIGSPFSHLNDGHIDLYYLQDCSRVKLVDFLLSMNNGDHLKNTHVQHIKVKGFRLDPCLNCDEYGKNDYSHSNSCLMSLDGERIPLKPIEIRTWSGVVNIICK